MLSTNHPSSITHSLQLVKHSLATPVTNLLFNLESVLKFKDNQKSNYQFHLQQAWLSAKYLRQLMNSLDDPNLNEKFKIKPALLEVLNLTKQPAKQRQLIQLLKISDQLALVGNQFFFQESIICLLNNAFEAYRPNSENKIVILNCEKKEKQLVIKVIDGAEGFKNLNQDQPTLFKLKEGLPYLESSKTNHLGYGLKFVNYIVSHHFRGSLKLHNHQGRGACVDCYFPLVDQQ